MTRLGHIADLHLGHRQYGLRQREDDMISTTRACLKELIDHNVDAILLPGDLFHSRDLRPKVLHDAERALELVPETIPVIASRGNHDENLTPRQVTWLNYLHQREKIVLLEAELDAELDAAGFDPYDEESDAGSAGFYDIEQNGEPPVRVFGLQWRGARADTALEQAARGIRAVNNEHGEPAFTVLLGHFGIEDEVPTLGGTITHAEIESVREVVDYLALGHIHKCYKAAGWIYNPGSPEAHSTQEGQPDWEDGFYTVEIGESVADNDGRNGSLGHKVTHHAAKRRPYYRIEFDVTPHGSPGELEDAFREHVESQRPELEDHCADQRFLADGDRRPPILHVHFEGTLQFERTDLRTDDLAEWAEDACEALHVQVNTSVRTADIQKLLEKLDGESVFVNGRLNTDALERRVFETIARESEYGEHADQVADVLERSHRMAQTNEAIEDISELVSESRRELFPGMTEDISVEVSEDPFEDEARADGEPADRESAPSSDGGEPR
jgi:DNA repair exonuclease SbcCD nuclease subunit